MDFVKEIRSNKLFKKRGKEKILQYQMSLSTSRNPDFVIRHPNETKEKNSSGWKVDIAKRVTKEFDVRERLLESRLRKRTSLRRLNQFD